MAKKKVIEEDIQETEDCGSIILGKVEVVVCQTEIEKEQEK